MSEPKRAHRHRSPESSGPISERVTIRLRTDLLQTLQILAIHQRVTLSSLANRIISDALRGVTVEVAGEETVPGVH